MSLEWTLIGRMLIGTIDWTGVMMLCLPSVVLPLHSMLIDNCALLAGHYYLVHMSYHSPPLLPCSFHNSCCDLANHMAHNVARQLSEVKRSSTTDHHSCNYVRNFGPRLLKIKDVERSQVNWATCCS